MAITAIMDPAVSGYNSYADVAFADGYVEILGVTNQTIWTNTSASAKNTSLIYATQNVDYFFSFPSVYERTNPEQLLEFPKKNVPVQGIQALRNGTQTRRDWRFMGLPSNKYDKPFTEWGDLDYAFLFSSLQDNTIPFFDENTIPVFLSQATVDFALIFLDGGTLDDVTSDDLKRAKLDVLEVEYFRNVAQSRGAPVLSKLGKWGIRYISDWNEPAQRKSSGRIGF